MSVELVIHVKAGDKNAVKEAIDALNRFNGGAGAQVDIEIKPEATAIETKAPASLEEQVANMPESELCPEENMVAPAGVELDAEGLPWDSRIHTDAKTKIKAGTWKLSRGVDPVSVAEVKEQLRLTMQAKPPEVAVIMPTQTVEVISSVTSEAAAVFGGEAPTLPQGATPVQTVDPVVTIAGAPVTGTMPQGEIVPANPAPVVVTFPILLQKITDRFKQPMGEHYKPLVQGVIENVGIPSIPMIRSRPDLIPEINDNLDLLWNSLNTQA